MSPAQTERASSFRPPSACRGAMEGKSTTLFHCFSMTVVENVENFAKRSHTLAFLQWTLCKSFFHGGSYLSRRPLSFSSLFSKTRLLPGLLFFLTHQVTRKVSFLTKRTNKRAFNGKTLSSNLQKRQSAKSQAISSPLFHTLRSFPLFPYSRFSDFSTFFE